MRISWGLKRHFKKWQLKIPPFFHYSLMVSFVELSRWLGLAILVWSIPADWPSVWELQRFNCWWNTTIYKISWKIKLKVVVSPKKKWMIWTSVVVIVYFQKCLRKVMNWRIYFSLVFYFISLLFHCSFSKVFKKSDELKNLLFISLLFH